MKYLEEIDYTAPEFGDWYDELPLWSAPFGLLLLDRLPLKTGLTILDVGAGTGFLTLELAQRCGPDAKVIAVDPWEAGMRRLRRKLDHLGLSNVVLMEQDAAAIELPDDALTAGSCPFFLLISSRTQSGPGSLIERSFLVGGLMGLINGMFAGLVIVYFIKRKPAG